MLLFTLRPGAPDAQAELRARACRPLAQGSGKLDKRDCRVKELNRRGCHEKRRRQGEVKRISGFGLKCR